MVRTATVARAVHTADLVLASGRNLSPYEKGRPSGRSFALSDIEVVVVDDRRPSLFADLFASRIRTDAGEPIPDSFSLRVSDFYRVTFLEITGYGGDADREKARNSRFVEESISSADIYCDGSCRESFRVGEVPLDVACFPPIRMYDGSGRLSTYDLVDDISSFSICNMNGEADIRDPFRSRYFRYHSTTTG